MKRIKTITSHVGVFRYMATLSEEPVGYVVNPAHIPSPYSFSLTRCVYRTEDGRNVILMETEHKRTEVYEVQDEPVYATHEQAEDAFLAPRN